MDLLVKLNPHVYLHEPVVSPPVQHHPSLVLVFGWMNARIEHVAKYVEQYASIYPSTTIAVVQYTSAQYYAFNEFESARHLFTPLLPILQRHQSKDRILIHTFSNGGCAQLLNVAKLQSKPLSPKLMVFDSAAGEPRYIISLFAFTIMYRNAFIRFLARLRFTFFYILNLVLDRLQQRKETYYNLWQGLRNKKLITQSAKRLFIYSKADRLVPWRDIEAHIQEVRRMGIRTESIRHENAGHVANVRADPKGYWGSVTKLWEEAVPKPRPVVVEPRRREPEPEVERKAEPQMELQVSTEAIMFKNPREFSAKL